MAKNELWVKAVMVENLAVGLGLGLQHGRDQVLCSFRWYAER
jgi:hypothetical protein